MIRLSLLYLFVGALSIVAFRDWFIALCGLILLTVLQQHPDMPSQMFGITGLNPWNACFLAVICGFFLQRSHQQAAPAPTAPLFRGLLWTYVAMVAVSALIAVVDASSVKSGRQGSDLRVWLLIDGAVNPLKFLAVGVLVYQGITTRRRAIIALLVGVGSALCYSLLMWKSMKLSVLTVDYAGARRVTEKLIGLYANDLGLTLAFAVWAGAFAALALVRNWQRSAWWIMTAGALPCFLCLKSRAGFLAFAAAGLALGVVRWRFLLALLPMAGAAAIVLDQSLADRIFTGLGDEFHTDWDEVSAGRMTNLWPPVIEQITHSPLIGHARYAILRTACHDEVLLREGVTPNHPHSAYLEILLDTGVFGLTICVSLMGMIGWGAIRLARRRDDPLMAAIGSAALAGVVAWLAAGVTGYSFYPSQTSVPYLCVWGVAMRAHWLLQQRELGAPVAQHVSVRRVMSIGPKPAMHAAIERAPEVGP
ncbi:MAG: O-antigen ligase family protein [Phycisphaerales bacterium]|nr:O-antigen ligase family protein [Phycisphaerales bacterium]